MNDNNDNVPSRRTEILNLKISSSTPYIADATVGQQWRSQDKKWCVIEWDKNATKASFGDLTDIFLNFEGGSKLNEVILPHLNEHKIGGTIPRDEYVNTYITTLIAKGARAAKFGEHDHIESAEADFADELIQRAGSGFKCKFNVAQIIGVLSPYNGDKQHPLLNPIRMDEVFGQSPIIAGLAPNGTKFKISRKTG